MLTQPTTNIGAIAHRSFCKRENLDRKKMLTNIIFKIKKLKRKEKYANCAQSPNQYWCHGQQIVLEKRKWQGKRLAKISGCNSNLWNYVWLTGSHGTRLFCKRKKQREFFSSIFLPCRKWFFTQIVFTQPTIIGARVTWVFCKRGFTILNFFQLHSFQI